MSSNSLVFHTSEGISSSRRILEGVRAKNLAVTILFIDLIHRGKMEQILLA